MMLTIWAARRAARAVKKTERKRDMPVHETRIGTVLWLLGWTVLILVNLPTFFEIAAEMWATGG